ncbi:hypothetical protein J8273_3252 [Carpediemonas membranifera]|uniref:Uncharacterized protein n=1 Tax=Carpediemonas membranifera TaxID=201153 RepID=A0A8J6B0S7_9EUKA|nr:hypothetical protein J8273_3252 [Carpediemonas membranifera]|eukprot:KAG9393123.1 hypothetical protein J8273_3252 [Carpediemonas membranifera]
MTELSTSEVLHDMLIDACTNNGTDNVKACVATVQEGLKTGRWDKKNVAIALATLSTFYGMSQIPTKQRVGILDNKYSQPRAQFRARQPDEVQHLLVVTEALYTGCPDLRRAMHTYLSDTHLILSQYPVDAFWPTEKRPNLKPRPIASRETMEREQSSYADQKFVGFFTSLQTAPAGISEFIHSVEAAVNDIRMPDAELRDRVLAAVDRFRLSVIPLFEALIITSLTIRGSDSGIKRARLIRLLKSLDSEENTSIQAFVRVSAAQTADRGLYKLMADMACAKVLTIKGLLHAMESSALSKTIQECRADVDARQQEVRRAVFSTASDEVGLERDRAVHNTLATLPRFVCAAASPDSRVALFLAAWVSVRSKEESTVYTPVDGDDAEQAADYEVAFAQEQKGADERILGQLEDVIAFTEGFKTDVATKAQRVMADMHVCRELAVAINGRVSQILDRTAALLPCLTAPSATGSDALARALDIHLRRLLRLLQLQRESVLVSPAVIDRLTAILTVLLSSMRRQRDELVNPQLLECIIAQVIVPCSHSALLASSSLLGAVAATPFAMRARLYYGMGAELASKDTFAGFLGRLGRYLVQGTLKRVTVVDSTDTELALEQAKQLKRDLLPVGIRFPHVLHGRVLTQAESYENAEVFAPFLTALPASYGPLLVLDTVHHLAVARATRLAVSPAGIIEPWLHGLTTLLTKALAVCAADPATDADLLGPLIRFLLTSAFGEKHQYAQLAIINELIGEMTGDTTQTFTVELARMTAEGPVMAETVFKPATAVTPGTARIYEALRQESSVMPGQTVGVAVIHAMRAFKEHAKTALPHTAGIKASLTAYDLAHSWLVRAIRVVQAAENDENRPDQGQRVLEDVFSDQAGLTVMEGLMLARTIDDSLFRRLQERTVVFSALELLVWAVPARDLRTVPSLYEQRVSRLSATEQNLMVDDAEMPAEVRLQNRQQRSHVEELIIRVKAEQARRHQDVRHGVGDARARLKKALEEFEEGGLTDDDRLSLVGAVHTRVFWSPEDAIGAARVLAELLGLIELEEAGVLVGLAVKNLLFRLLTASPDDTKCIATFLAELLDVCKQREDLQLPKLLRQCMAQVCSVNSPMLVLAHVQSNVLALIGALADAKAFPEPSDDVALQFVGDIINRLIAAIAQAADGELKKALMAQAKALMAALGIKPPQPAPEKEKAKAVVATQPEEPLAVPDDDDDVDMDTRPREPAPVPSREPPRKGGRRGGPREPAHDTGKRKQPVREIEDTRRDQETRWGDRKDGDRDRRDSDRDRGSRQNSDWSRIPPQPRPRDDHGRDSRRDDPRDHDGRGSRDTRDTHDGRDNRDSRDGRDRDARWGRGDRDERPRSPPGRRPARGRRGGRR